MRIGECGVAGHRTADVEAAGIVGDRAVDRAAVGVDGGAVGQAPGIVPVVVSDPPLTVAPPLSCPALVVVPAVLVSSPDTVPLALLLKVPELLTVPVTAPLLLKVAALVTFEVMDPVEASVSVPPLIVVAPVSVGAGQRLGAGRQRQPAVAADRARERVAAFDSVSVFVPERDRAGARQRHDRGARGGGRNIKGAVGFETPLDAAIEPVPDSASVPP